MKYYIDCEFDGHRGALLSMGIVRGDGQNIYIETSSHAQNPWVIENVLPIMNHHNAASTAYVPSNYIGTIIRDFIGNDDAPIIIADSPVDIARFTDAISTDEHGNWASTGYPWMIFEVYNVDCYPTKLEGAVQHNAWWDAMALREKLNEY